LSVHIIADLKNCKPSALVWDEALVDSIKQAVASVSTVLDSTFTVFDNNAYTGVMLLAESHFSIHTWPEHSTCCFDLFTCGTADPLEAARIIAQLLTGRNDTSFSIITRTYT
jgi:S-adenosylmethionine decarboxylase